MAEVIHIVDDNVIFDGVAYTVQVCGRPRGNIWEGWIEFASIQGPEVLRSPRETTQPNREALEYWAGGLSGTYLEGAFARAVRPTPASSPTVVATPHFEAPAATVSEEVAISDRAILDPFSVGAKGESLLRRELGALRGWHLRNIVRAYDLADESVDLERLTEDELVELIVGAVEAR